MPISGWMGGQILLCTYHGLLLNHKKERGTGTCCTIDGLQKHAKWKKPDRKGYNSMWFPLYEISGIGKSTDTESRLVAPGTEGKGNAEGLLHGREVLLRGDDNVVKLDGGSGCSTLWMDQTPLNCTFSSDSFQVSFPLKNKQLENKHVWVMLSYSQSLFLMKRFQRA